MIARGYKGLQCVYKGLGGMTARGHDQVHELGERQAILVLWFLLDGVFTSTSGILEHVRTCVGLSRLLPASAGRARAAAASRGVHPWVRGAQRD